MIIIIMFHVALVKYVWLIRMAKLRFSGCSKQAFHGLFSGLILQTIQILVSSVGMVVD